MAGDLRAKHGRSYMLHFRFRHPVGQILFPFGLETLAVLICPDFFFKRQSARITENDLRHRRHNRGQNPGAVFVPPLLAGGILSLPGRCFLDPCSGLFTLGTCIFPALYNLFMGLFHGGFFFVFGNASMPLHDLCPCAFVVA